jgi:pyrroloquinoline quinone biosynthesis protein A
VSFFSQKEIAMWTKPEYTEMRFGFEVTMYIANR